MWVIKKHETDVESSEESPILIYPNKIESRIVFKIKTGYKLELLTNEAMRLLGDGPIADTDKNGENVPRLEQVRFVLLHCNVVRNDHLQNSKLLYAFVPSDDFGKLLFVEPKVLKQSKTTDSVFDYIKVWFTDQNNRSLQVEDDVSLCKFKTFKCIIKHDLSNTLSSKKVCKRIWIYELCQKIWK